MASLVARGALPSSAIKANYQKALTSLVEEMRGSVLYWIKARYRAREDEIVVAPDIAQDRSPSRDLEKEINELFRQWEKRFEDFAKILARSFGRRTNTNTTRQLYNAMRDAGLTVKFKNSRRVNNMLQSIIAENTGLIRSIPRDSMSKVRTIVMQGVQNGRDMSFIADEIQERFKKTRNEAVRIAVDQTNKATEAISRARCEDIGVTHGFWMHRSGSKDPRESHVKMNGKRFKLSEGLYDYSVGYNVKPGELIWCRCTFKLDLSTIGAGVAMDARMIAGGRRRLELPAATIEWGKAA